MYPALDPGAVGIRLPFEEMCALAAKTGFGGVPAPLDLAAERGAGEVRAILDGHGLVASHWGCPVNLGAPDEAFEAALASLDGKAALAAGLGCDRCVTWLSPASDELEYAANFERHAKRIRRVGEALARHGCRFGIEYIGTKSLWEKRRHPFVHTMKGLLDLLKAAGADNLGVLLDSWHWHCAGDSAGEIESLPCARVVLVHLNDAPRGVPKEDLVDNRRELPGATGVIDIAGFVGALGRIGYDGPAAAEPFNQEVNGMEDEAAAGAVIASLGKVMG